MGHSKCALLLMDCGAQYWLMNKYGKDPYILAMERGNEIIARAIQARRDEKKRLHELEFGVESDEEIYSDEDVNNDEVEQMEKEGVTGRGNDNDSVVEVPETRKKEKRGFFSRFSK